MAKSGGQGNATGVSYQALAIAKSLLDVYQGTAEWVRAELPKNAELGRSDLITVTVDDYIVSNDGRLSYYQAKSGIESPSQWTVSRLKREGVLSQFQNQIAHDATGKCVLITPCHCPLLQTTAERARNAQSKREFETNLTKAQAKDIKSLLKATKLTFDDAFPLLTKCSIEPIAYSTLAAYISKVSQILFSNPKAAYDCLTQLATTSMTQDMNLDAAAVHDYMSKRGCLPAPRTSIVQIRAAIQLASATLRLSKKDVSGIIVQRPVVASISEWCGSKDGPGLAMLLDGPGSGKTAALSMLLATLEERGHAVLGLKVDTIGAFSTISEFTSHVQLPEAPSVIAAALKAKCDQVTILIDQVDALSSSMTRDDDSIGIIIDEVSRLLCIPGVRIVLSCRDFDWRYDIRLRQLQGANPKEFKLGNLSDDDVSQVLKNINIGLGDLHSATAQLLRIPNNLHAFVEMVQTKRKHDAQWSPRLSTVYTLQQLYEERWEEGLRQLSRANISDQVCTSLVEQLADAMLASQRLMVPRLAYEKERDALDWLCSQGFLVRQDASLRFFHQTFFDFIVARKFAKERISLAEHLLKTNQSLFHRPLVRQFLEYYRGIDFSLYLAQLKEIISDSKIRAHIKTMVWEWLGQISDPRLDELGLHEPSFVSGDTLDRTLRRMRGNPAWFDQIGGDRIVSWLKSRDGDSVNHVVYFLSGIFQKRQPAIASLLKPFAGKSMEWNNRIIYCLTQIKEDWDDSSIDLFFAVLRDQSFPMPLNNYYVYMALQNLSTSAPDRACLVIQSVLLRSVDAALIGASNSKTAPAFGLQLFPDEYCLWEAIHAAAVAAPLQFLATMLPVIDLILERLSVEHDWIVPRKHRIFAEAEVDSSKQDLHDTSSKFVYELRQAIVSLCKISPSDASVPLSNLAERPVDILQCLVAHACAVQPETLHQFALKFLLADSSRLRLSSLGNSVWFSKRLLIGCAPFWTKEDTSKVETLILQIFPRKAKSLQEISWIQQSQLELLMAFEKSRLTGAGLSYLGQLERKFPGFSSPERISMECVSVGAPIPQESIGKMKNRDWLRAMKLYVGNWEGRMKPIALSGGKRGLAQALKARAQAEPHRFYLLARNEMNSSYEADYLCAIIEGLADAKAPVSNVEELIFQYQKGLEGDCVRPISSAIGKYESSAVSGALVNLLKRWAHSCSDPSSEDSHEKRESDRDLINEGLNSDRGSAVWNLGSILLNGNCPNRLDYIKFSETLISEKARAVKAVCLLFLQYAVPANPERVCRLLVQLIGNDRALLASSGTEGVIHRAINRSADRVMWAIEALVADDVPAAQSQGAQLACLAAFQYPGARPLRDNCLAGSVAMRCGAARVFAANINSSTVAQECRTRLRSLWADPDESVRDAAAGFLQYVTQENLREAQCLVETWLGSAVTVKAIKSAAQVVHDNPTVNPEVTLKVATRALEVAGRNVANFQSGDAMLAFYLVPAVVSVYQKTHTLRDAAMDLIEKFDDLGCSEVKTAYASVDRI